MDNENEATSGEQAITTEYPLATDALAKGSYVPAEDIEAAFGVQRHLARYQLVLMRAAEYIEGRFADRGEVVFVVQEKGGLRVLTDEEAPAYAEKRFREGMRAAGRAHARQLAADRSRMSDAVRVQHDRALEVHGRMLAAMRREQRKELVAPTERQTPRALTARKKPT